MNAGVSAALLVLASTAAADELPRTDPKSWSKHGWGGLNWNMGPADAVPLVPGTGGETWRPSPEEQDALGLFTALAHAVIIPDSVYGFRTVATLKFDAKSQLFGV